MSENAKQDTFIDAEVAKAMAPYLAMGLSAELLEEIERLVRFTLEVHPAAQQLVKALRPRAALQQSEKIRSAGFDASSAEPNKARKRGAE